MIDTTELSALLPAHLERERWFGGWHAGSARPAVTVLDQSVLCRGSPGLVRVVVGSEDTRYQLLLGLRGAEAEVSAQAASESTVPEPASVLGTVHTEEGPVLCYDALVDPELAIALLGIVAPELEPSSVRRALSERSNSALVYDEQFILKIFRRLSGVNPHAEVVFALAQGGFAWVPSPLARWQSEGDDLGIVERFLPAASDGWALALTSLRDLCSYGGPPEEAGADFAPEASRLGRLTAEMHDALAGAFGRAAAHPDEWAGRLRSRLEKVGLLDPDAAKAMEVADRLAQVSDSGAEIRCHGDYHLGQVLRADEGWVVVDFEDDPDLPLEDRRAPQSPLCDVASMLRSFQYAASVAVLEHRGEAAGLAEAWELRNREAFLESYRSSIAVSGLVPADDLSFSAVLGAYEMDKAIHEVGYELHHRPRWLTVPLAGLRRLLGGVSR